ncbi:MAG: PilZ domain-containing protein [Acidobacteriota bacterium]
MKNPSVKGKEMTTPPKTYSPEQIRDYLSDLKELLDYIEESQTHYEVLDVDELATTGEIKIAYMRAAALLNPGQFNLELPQPEDLLPRIDEAFERVSLAFSVLVNFTRRAEYDDTLFERESDEAAGAENFEHFAATVESEMHLADIEERQRANERRRHRRFELALPVTVMGYNQNGDKWNEMTQSVDVSVSGVLMHLTTAVQKGQILKISMPMPMTLRNHAFFENSYEVYAIVRRIDAGEQSAKFIGVEFIGEQPPQAYFEKPWGIFQTDTPNMEERRRTPRKKGKKTFRIEYYNNELILIGKEEAVSEDFGLGGIRLCVKEAPGTFNLVRVISASGKFDSLAQVTKRSRGKDGIERLSLAFIHNSERVN